MMVGLLGTVLHVAAWVMAIVFDLITGVAINSEQSPGAFTYWLWGFTTLLVGFVALVSVTLWHAISDPANKIPEGGAPPFLMSLFIGGGQISLTLTVLQMIASAGATGSGFDLQANSSLTGTERDDERNAQRQLMVWSSATNGAEKSFSKGSNVGHVFSSNVQLPPSPKLSSRHSTGGGAYGGSRQRRPWPATSTATRMGACPRTSCGGASSASKELGERLFSKATSPNSSRAAARRWR